MSGLVETTADRPLSRFVPEYIEYAAAASPNPVEADNVEHTMLDMRPTYPSAACVLTPVFPLPFRPIIGKGFQLGRDTSFTRQLNQVIEAPDSIHPAIPCPPDAYVVTANSAIPIADAVRGYFDAKGAPRPHITHIQANRQRAKIFWNAVATATKPEDVDLSAFDDEVQRLREELDGAEHVTIVDQYVFRGHTLMCAGGPLHLAGIPHITGIRGRWYEHVEELLVDTKNLTAKSAFIRTLMTDIGHRAFNDSHS